jgi:protein subunit release factor B
MDFGDLKKNCDITAFRASGPGGQHRNVTDSAVRLKHRPTGIVVIGRRHRSQHRNMEDALQRLAERIEERKRATRRRKRIPTKKSGAVRKREIAEKRRRGKVKSLRGRIGED